MLNIVLSNQPHIISNVTVIPGRCVHEAVSFIILTSLDKHKFHPRKIYHFTKLIKNPS